MIIPLIIIPHTIIDRSNANNVRSLIDSAATMNTIIMLDASKIEKVEPSGFEVILSNIHYIHKYQIFVFGLKKSVAKALKVDSLIKNSSSIYETTVDKVLYEIKRWCKKNAR